MLLNSQNIWKRVNPFLLSVDYNSIHFPSENIGYIVGTRGIVLKTTDAGNTWNFDNQHNCNDLLSVHFINDTLGYIYTGYNLFKTINGGNSWTTISFNCNGYFGSHHSQFCTFKNNAWVCGGMRLGNDHFPGPLAPIISRDIGYCVVYTDVVDEFVSIYSMHDSIMFLGTSYNNLYRRSSSGTSVIYVGQKFIKFSFPVANIGFALNDSGKVFKTINNGDTWTMLNIGASMPVKSVYFSSLNNGVLIGKTGTIFKTTDSGITWDSLNIGTTNNLNEVFFTNDTTGYIVGDNESIFKTIDGGNNWIPYIFDHTNTTPENLKSISFPSKDAAYFVGNNGVILKTTDLGNTFTLQHISDNLSLSLQTDSNEGSFSKHKITSFTNLNASFFINNDFGFVAGDSGKIYKTINGGTTWTSLSTNIQDNIYSLFFVNDSVGFATCSNGIIIKTNNSGSNWSLLNSGTSKYLYASYFVNPDTGIVVGGYGTIIKTSNGGNNWISITDTGYTYRSVKFFNNNYGIIAGGDGSTPIIYITKDGGTTWINQNINRQTYLKSIFLTDTSTVWAVGTSGNIFKSVNDFVTLNNKVVGCSQLNSVAFISPDTAFIAGNNGVIYRTFSGSALYLPPTPSFSNILSLSDNISVYPNPTTGYVNIEFQKADTYNIFVSDIFGNIILHDNNSYNLLKSINLSKLSEGIYFIKIVNKNSSCVFKILKM